MSRQIDEQQSVVRFASHIWRPFRLLSLSACCAFAAFYGLVAANDGLTAANDGLTAANDGLAAANDGLAAANEKPTGADEEKRLFTRDAMRAATPKNACVRCKNFLVVMPNKTDVRVGAIG